MRSAVEALRQLGYAEEAKVFSNSEATSGLAREAARLLRELSSLTFDEEPANTSDKAKTRRRGGRRAVAKKGALGAAAASRIPSVDSVPGIGKVATQALAAKGIYDVLDLLLFLPKRYDDERKTTPISQIEIGTRALCAGVVVASRVAGGGRKRRAEVSLEPLRGEPPGNRALLRLVWFRSHWVAARLRPGQRVLVSGAVDEYRGVATMTHPDLTELEPGQAAGRGIVPVYPLVRGVPPARLRKAIASAFERHLDLWPEAVPAQLRGSRGAVKDALRALHHPPEDLDRSRLELLNSGRSEAHQRLAFEEFFILSLALEARRQGAHERVAHPLVAKGEAWRSEARVALGFELTGAQQRCVDEIAKELASERPMRRLLQGDVGSGKTAVAVLSAAHAISAGAQVAFLAPTEVLAEQHMRSLAPVARALGLRIALLVGGARASHRKKTLAGLASGGIDLVVGTHAILSDKVEFKDLGLAIVDEQHRFGVSQRLRLATKGKLDPHLLVMTATPIPRSLALALYGDLQVSVLDEKPPGRVPPLTRAYSEAERDEAYRQVSRAIEHGGQVFVVCPAIEPSEVHVLRDAMSVCEELRMKFPNRCVELMHGQQKPELRQAAMEKFVAGRAQILVSTTVIEVGVDVSKANAMVIENAERFGLAQLHQLRGRVGRGGQKSACLLIHDARTDEANARIDVLVRSHDGFEIAEEDLKLRGPGEVFGRQQSGLSGFRFADLRRDLHLLTEARAIAIDLLADDPHLQGDGVGGARWALERSGRTIVLEEAG